jgi:hypothetical protein
MWVGADHDLPLYVSASLEPFPIGWPTAIQNVADGQDTESPGYGRPPFGSSPPTMWVGADHDVPL